MSNLVTATPVVEGPPAIGATLQALRQGQKLSLDELSKRAGVSKSMLSQIERNTTNPTVAVLWRLSNALGVSITDFLAGGRAERTTPTITVVAAHETPSLINPDGKSELRILGPIELAGKFEWYELVIQPGGALVSDGHEPGAKEHLSVVSGSVVVRVGTEEKKLRQGETARYAVDVPHAIANAGKSPAIMLLVVAHSD